jgi:bifunctional non-homologous end joining protein LigD
VAKIPFRVSPMLATLVDAPFTRENWIFEEKYDGVRMLAYKEGSRVSLISRNAIDRTERYTHIAESVRGLKADTLLLDGEIVVFDAKGVSRFQLLQRSEGHPQYAVFDCLYHNGRDLRRRALSERRDTLESLIQHKEPLLLSANLSCDGFEAFKIASKRGLEGVVGKNLNSFYESRRSREWLKVKVHQQQEFVIEDLPSRREHARILAHCCWVCTMRAGCGTSARWELALMTRPLGLCTGSSDL